MPPKPETLLALSHSGDALEALWGQPSGRRTTVLPYASGGDSERGICDIAR